MKKNWLVVLGFGLFVLGITSLAMSLVGARWAFLRFIESSAVPLLPFLIKVAMVMAGVVCVVLGKTDWAKERADSSGEGDPADN